MKIPFTNIEIGRDIDKIENVTRTKPRGVNIDEKIDDYQLYQERYNLNDFVSAVDRANNITSPSRLDITKVYNEVYQDGHLIGIINALKSSISKTRFKLTDKNGEELEEKTYLFNQKWFYDYLSYSLDAEMYGYSLLEIGDVEDDIIQDLTLIPRQNVIPEWECVTKNVNTISKTSALYYNEKPYDKWSIFIGYGNLGMLHKVTPHVIAKKNLMIQTWRYAELFGSPFRALFTDVTDRKQVELRMKMLRNMGNAGYGTFAEDEKLELIEGKNGGVKSVYLDPIKYHNEEISKALAGQTGMFDEKTYSGSAKTHENLYNDFIKSRLREYQFNINGVLIPKMIALGIPLNDVSFEWINEDNISINDKVKHVVDLTKTGYKFTEEEIKTYTGLNVEQTKEEKNKDVGNYFDTVNEVLKGEFKFKEMDNHYGKND